MKFQNKVINNFAPKNVLKLIVIIFIVAEVNGVVTMFFLPYL
jgi:hypothetical protein